MARKLRFALNKSWMPILFIVTVDVIEWATALKMPPLSALCFTIFADVASITLMVVFAVKQLKNVKKDTEQQAKTSTRQD